jgi:hypothetical protein
MSNKIYAQKNGSANEQDRLALAALLVKMGYTVRIGKEKRSEGKSTIYTHFVEYKEE